MSEERKCTVTVEFGGIIVRQCFPDPEEEMNDVELFSEAMASVVTRFLYFRKWIPKFMDGFVGQILDHSEVESKDLHAEVVAAIEKLVEKSRAAN